MYIGVFLLFWSATAARGTERRARYVQQGARPSHKQGSTQTGKLLWSQSSRQKQRHDHLQLATLLFATSAISTRPLAKYRSRHRLPQLTDRLTSFDIDTTPRSSIQIYDFASLESFDNATDARPLLTEELAQTDSSILALDAKIEMLQKQRAALQSKRRSLANLVDEVRFEVTSLNTWNGPILATLFGAVLMTILWEDVQAIAALAYWDSSMEADWIPTSIQLLMRLPSDLVQSYGSWAGSSDLDKVLLTKALTSATSYFLGDLVAQFFEGRQRAFLLDLPRLVRNTLLGFFLHGPVLHFWIQTLEGPVGSAVGGNDLPATVFLKIFLDQTFFTSAINLAYATLDNLLADRSFSDSFARARAVLVPSVVASWRFWPFVHLLSYSPIIPVEFKLLWIDIMEIVWVAILSTTVNSGSSATPSKPVPWGEGRLKLIKARTKLFAQWLGSISKNSDSKQRD